MYSEIPVHAFKIELMNTVINIAAYFQKNLALNVLKLFYASLLSLILLFSLYHLSLSAQEFLSFYVNKNLFEFIFFSPLVYSHFSLFIVF
jgi:hypothetical protein